MGVALSSGSGVVKATGLLDSNPLHMLVGVVVTNELSTAVGAACVALVQETIKKIPMIAMTGSAKGICLRDSIVAPLTADIR